jgi:hypothetical protein
MLALTGLGLVRLTSVKNSGNPLEQSAAKNQPKSATQAVPFRLLLSAPATEVEVNAVRLAADPPISGILETDPRNPRVALVVRWKNPTSTGEHRFAKLTLEAPGQETLTHIFDAAGDIDDFIELPLPATE